MKITSAADKRVLDYLKRNGTGNPSYVGMWKDAVNNEVLDAIRAHDWSEVPIRNYDIYEGASASGYDELREVTFTSAFVNKDSIRWQIINTNSLDYSLEKLYNKLYNDFDKFKVWITRIDPGCCIPQHIDTVNAFIEEFDIAEKDISNIKRLVILPEDVKPWHHLWYGNTIISDGRQGDVWSFSFWEPHGGSNLGPEPKYTLQVIAI
jgi:hypothetical protein